MLLARNVCVDPCTITGRVPYSDPVAGRSTLVTVLNSGADGSGPAWIAMIAATGTVIWQYQLPGFNWYALAPAPVPSDSTGHLFLNYNPGRYNGVIVLAPTGTGVDDFQSLPGNGSEGRFYSATAVDPTHSGTFQIDVSANNCIPNCAEGTDVHTIYTWNGITYVAG